MVLKLNVYLKKKLLGTGGSLENAKKYIVNNTLVCNGDTYFDYNFQRLNKIKFRNILLILVKNKIYKSNNKLCNLSVVKKKVVYKKQSTYMNSGFYLLNKKFKKYLKKTFFPLKMTLLKNS